MIRHCLPGVSDSDLGLVREALREQRRPAHGVERDVVTFLAAHHDQDRHQFPDLHLRAAVDYRPEQLIGRDCEPLGVQTMDRTPLRIGDTIARVHVRPAGPAPALDTAGLTVQPIPHLGTVPLRPTLADADGWIAHLLQRFSGRTVDPSIDDSLDGR